MSLVEIIKERRSIRSFTEKLIDIDKIKEIIELGTYAPTACNKQDWRFIVLDKSKLIEIRKNVPIKYKGAKVIDQAPIGVLVLYSPPDIGGIEYSDSTQSVSACIENMLLAAAFYGIGSCWICCLPPKEWLKEKFSIPIKYDPFALVVFGYSSEKPVVHRKYKTIDELISYNKFKD